MKKIRFFTLLLFLTLILPIQTYSETIPVGLGSYTTDWPDYTSYSFKRPVQYSDFLSGFYGPPQTIFKTDDFSGPVPTNDWWSRLVWDTYSGKLYSVPLAFQFHSGGMDVTAQHYELFSDATNGSWDWTDFIINGTGLSPVDTRLDDDSDWSVDIKMADAAHSVTARLITGSPFFYLTFDNCQPVITFDMTSVYSEQIDGTVITNDTIPNGNYTGDTIRTFDSRGHYWGWFAPQGTVFNINGNTMNITLPAGENWLVVGLLALGDPSNWEAPPLGSFTNLNSLHQFFYNHAYAWPTNTQFTWNYDKPTSTVSLNYHVSTASKQYGQTETLQGILPHQYKHMDQTYSGVTYQTYKGMMKILDSNSFTTNLTFHGLMPYLPIPSGGSFDPDLFRDYLLQRLKKPIEWADVTLGHDDWVDTYWTGKFMATIADYIPMAHLTGNTVVKDHFINILRENLTDWYTVDTDLQENSNHFSKSFVYIDDWKGLFGFLPGFGSEHFSDHHFHYGYFIYASALLSLWDENFASQYGGMVDLLIREIASPDRNDLMFPFLRDINPYFGHSWASGIGSSEEGNNQESVSEALNAWAGIALWGAITGNTQYEELGVVLHTLEYSAAREYWYDIDRDTYNHDIMNQNYVTSLVFGNKSISMTWFSVAPEHKHGIIYLPIGPCSLFLGLDPQFVENDYNAILAETNNNITKWLDIMYSYEAFYDPANAFSDFESSDPITKTFPYMFINNLNNLGQVDASISADTSLYAVFDKNGTKNYMAYNPNDFNMTVSFSDGFHLMVPAKSLASTEGIDSPVNGDQTPPERPINFAAESIESTNIRLSWDASTDDVALAGYNLYRNGVFVKTVFGTDTIDTGLTPSTENTYELTAYDHSNNESEKSDPVIVTTQPSVTQPECPPYLYTDTYYGGSIHEYQLNTALSTITIDDMEDAYFGPYCIKIRSTGYGEVHSRFDFYNGATINDPGIDLSSYNGLDLYLKADLNCFVWVRFGDICHDSGMKQNKFYVTTSWQKFHLSFSNMDIGTKEDINVLLSITLHAADNNHFLNHTLYVDNIIFTGGPSMDTNPPTTPQNLTASTVSVSRVDLSWDTSTDDIAVQGYKIYRDGSYIKTTTGTSIADTGLTPNTTYIYRVSAIDISDNESGLSTPAGATTTDTVPPSAPSNLTATETSATSVDLSWNPATDDVGVTGYNIYRDSIYLMTESTTSVSDDTVMPNITYGYTITALDAAGNESLFSNSASVSTTDSEAPTIPQNLSVAAVSSDTIDLSWSPSTDNASIAGYKIYRDGAYIRSVSSTPQSDTGLSPDTTYTYSISAYDSSDNESDQSNTASATTYAFGEQTPWKSNENGNPITDQGGEYTMGYRFTPVKNGTITKLGGLFNGTKTVSLWHTETGTLLTQAEVTSSNSWSFTNITPVPVTAGANYTVAMYSADTGISYRSNITELPQTYGDITITASSLISGNAIPIHDFTSSMYGQVDISFIPESETSNTYLIYSDAGFPASTTVYMWKGLNGNIYAIADTTSPEGDYCATISGDSWIGWGIFYTDGTHDMSAYDGASLSFWVRSTADLKVSIKTSGAAEQWISSYGWDGTATWQRIEIPLSALASDLSAVEAPFTLTSYTGATFSADYVTWSFGSGASSAPKITTLPYTSAVVNRLYQYDVNAIDLNDDILTYSLTTSPAGMTINASTGLISWTPSDSQTGIQSVSVSVSDGNGGTDLQNFNINTTVSAPSDLMIYSDAGFPSSTTVYVWKGQNGIVDAVTDASPPEGIYCSKTTGDSWIGWGIFYTDGTHDLNQYENGVLSFWVKTPVDLKVSVHTSAGATEHWISTSGWDGTNTWQNITMPLSAFSSDLSAVEAPFTITTYNGTVFYVDDIKWDY